MFFDTDADVEELMNNFNLGLSPVGSIGDSHLGSPPLSQRLGWTTLIDALVWVAGSFMFSFGAPFGVNFNGIVIPVQLCTPSVES